MRFVGQFTTGYSNYTEDPDTLFADLTLDDMIAEIKGTREQTGIGPNRHG